MFNDFIGVKTSANEKAGQSGRKRVKSGSLYVFPTARGATEYIAYAINGFCPICDNPGQLYPEPYAVRTKSQVNKQAKHPTFYKFEKGISFAEHWKLVAESSEFHLTLKRAHRVHFFPNTPKKRDILSEKRESGAALKKRERESGAALKKRELTPESGIVDTYVI